MGESRAFNEFIEENNLVNLPLIGREYTWYKYGSTAMSRIDRFLLSENWLQNWGNLTQ